MTITAASRRPKRRFRASRPKRSPWSTLATFGATTLIVTLGAPNESQAANVVGIAGSGGCSFPTIAAAIAAASPGDEILVSPGTYYENLGSISTSLTITSADSTCTSSAASGAIIDGSGAQIAYISAPVTFANITLQDGFDANGGLLEVGDDLTLDSATLLDGSADWGGCIYAVGGSVNVLGSSLISGCEALVGNGGGIYARQSDVHIGEDAVIENNFAVLDGGGLFAFLNHTRIDGNAQLRANVADAGGGGICLSVADLEVLGYAHIDDNTAAHGGGGIAVPDPGPVDVWVDIRGHASVSRNVVTDSYGQGGGIGLFSNTGGGGLLYLHLDVSGYATIEDNEALGAAGTGGGIRANGGDVKIRQQAYIDGNRAASGAGVFVLYSELETDGGEFWRNIAQGSGGGIYASRSPAFINNSYFGGNLALNGNGGGIYTSGDDSDLTITNDGDYCLNAWAGTNNYCSSFIGNLAAGLGGGVYAGDGPVLIEHTAFIGNLGHDGFGYFGDANTNALVENALFAENSGPNDAAAVRTDGTMSLVHVTVASNLGVGVRYGPASSGFVIDSIVWANVDGLHLSGGSLAANNILQSVYGMHSATIFSNPMFTTTLRGDYRLGPSSPAIDAASSSIGLDLDRVTRPKGAANDIGAFEHF